MLLYDGLEHDGGLESHRGATKRSAKEHILGEGYVGWLAAVPHAFRVEGQRAYVLTPCTMRRSVKFKK